ncbi:hypothetical protein [Streptomyces sp. NPDC097619]|uniref:P-loop NTPase n=1 Tax=Streptomyces sp. NPDC097619 TaxID=3157228 RepID=UPI00331D2548
MPERFPPARAAAPAPGPAHLLLLGPLPPDPAAARRAVLDDLARLHAEGRRLDALLAFGSGGGTPEGASPDAARGAAAGASATDELLVDLRLACGEAGYEPPVLLVPAPEDLSDGPTTRLLELSLVVGWEQVAPRLWDGSADEALLRPLREEVFGEFAARTAAVAVHPETWRPGLLPGEGSCRLRTPTGTLGLVCLNTVFRMVGTAPSSAGADLAGCSAEQLDRAVGEPFADWAAGHDLTLLLAGRAGDLPGGSLGAAPVLAVAGDPEATDGGADGWHLPFTGRTRAHALLTAEPADGRPVVTDTAGRRLSTTARQRPAAPNRPPVDTRPEPPYDEKALLGEFHPYLAHGEMVLVLVSGADEGVPDGDELNRTLAAALYGPDPHPHGGPHLHETWAAARRRFTPQQLSPLLKGLSVPADQDAPTAHGLLRAPWWRIYDLTGSDALPAARNARLADSVSLVDARTDYPTAKGNALEAVSLHGWPAPDGALPEFGDAWTRPAEDARGLWFRRLRAELLTRPVVFLSRTPGSPALWEALRIAGRSAGQQADFPGFVVSAPGSGPERERLRDAGLRHLRMDPAEFVHRCLGPGSQAVSDGRRVLNADYAGTRDGVGVVRVARLLEQSPSGSREFLMGRDPNWGDITDKKIAAQLSLAAAIEDRARPTEGGRLPIVLVKGTAGSGKTTALMQVAYRFHKKDPAVGWVDRGASLPPREIEQQVRQQGFGAVFVDDVDMFASRAGSLLKNLNDDGRTLVVAAIRVTRQSELGAGFPAEEVSADQLLTEDDLERIIKALGKNALIGALKQYFFMHQKVAALRARCDQGLLAAMIETVTGTSLKKKVGDEFEELAPGERAPYAVVSFSDSSLVFQQRGIDKADLLEIVSHPEAPDRAHLDAVNRLVAMNLLVHTPDGRLRCRQRTIADTVVETVLRHRKDDLEWVIAKLLLFYAGRAWNIRDNRHRDRSAMIKLLNHDTMRRLDLDTEAVRRIYAAAHEFLQDDHHYWLQRAGYETELGRLDLAENHIAAARACPGGAEDRLVVTADARVRLRSSTADPGNHAARSGALGAVRDLSRVAERYRAQAPHAFVALARDGVRWLETCGAHLTPQEYGEVLDDITAGVDLGKECCPTNNQVATAAELCAPRLRILRQRRPGIPY